MHFKSQMWIRRRIENCPNKLYIIRLGTQVMLLVASETGHVYTFATKKLQPMITSEAGKALIQTCLNSPDEMEPEGDRISFCLDVKTELDRYELYIYIRKLSN